MSDLYIDTDKGRLYITGDNAVEMIVPPGYKIQLELVRDQVQKLPDIPPIEYDMSEAEAMLLITSLMRNGKEQK